MVNSRPGRLQQKLPFQSNIRTAEKLDAGVSKLNRRLQQLEEIDKQPTIDYNSLEPVVHHFVRNIAEIFGDPSPEYTQYENSGRYLHLAGWNTRWSEDK